MQRKAAYVTFSATKLCNVADNLLTRHIKAMEDVWLFGSTETCESGERHTLGDKHNWIVDLISGQGFLGLPQ